MAYLNYNVVLLKTIREALLEALLPAQENLVAVAENRLAPTDLSSQGVNDAMGNLSLVGRFSLVQALHAVSKAIESINNSRQLGWSQEKVSSVALAASEVVGQVIRQCRAAEVGRPAGPLELMRAWVKMALAEGVDPPQPINLFDGDADVDPSRFSPMDVQVLRETATPHLEKLSTAYTQLRNWPESDTWENILGSMEEVFEWAAAIQHRLGFHAYLTAARARIAWERLSGEPANDPAGRERHEQLVRAIQQSTMELRKFSEDARRSRHDSLLEMMRPLLTPWDNEWTSRHQALSEALDLFNLAEFWRQTSPESLASSNSVSSGPSAAPILRQINTIKSNWASQATASMPDFSSVVSGLNALIPQYSEYVNTHKAITHSGGLLVACLTSLRDHLVANSSIPRPAYDEVATLVVIVEDTLAAEEDMDQEDLDQRAQLACRRVQAALRGESVEDMPQPMWSARRLSSLATSAASTATAELSKDIAWIIDVVDEYYRRDPASARMHYDEAKTRALAGQQVMRALGQGTAASIIQEVVKDLSVLSRQSAPDINGKEYARLTASLAGIQAFLDAFSAGDADAGRLLAPALEVLGMGYSLDRGLTEFNPQMRPSWQEDVGTEEQPPQEQSTEEQFEQDPVESGQVIELPSSESASALAHAQPAQPNEEESAADEYNPAQAQADDFIPSPAFDEANYPSNEDQTSAHAQKKGGDFDLLDTASEASTAQPEVSPDSSFDEPESSEVEPAGDDSVSDEAQGGGYTMADMEDFQVAAADAFRNNLAWTDRVEDVELVDAYVEETLSVFERLEEAREQCRSNPTNQEAMLTLRRQFHTLKGSGRMSSLWGVAEYAAQVESRLNLARNNEEPYTPAIDSMVELAAGRLSEFLGELSRRGEVNISQLHQKELKSAIMSSMPSEEEVADEPVNAVPVSHHFTAPSPAQGFTEQDELAQGAPHDDQDLGISTVPAQDLAVEQYEQPQEGDTSSLTPDLAESQEPDQETDRPTDIEPLDTGLSSEIAQDGSPSEEGFPEQEQLREQEDPARQAEVEEPEVEERLHAEIQQAKAQRSQPMPAQDQDEQEASHKFEGLDDQNLINEADQSEESASDQQAAPIALELDEDSLEDVLTDLRTHRDNLRNIVWNNLGGDRIDVSLLVWSVHTLASLCRSLNQERFRAFCKTLETKLEADHAAQQSGIELPEDRQAMMMRFASIALEKTELLLKNPTRPLEWDSLDEGVEEMLANFEQFDYQAQGQDLRALTEEDKIWEEVESRFASIVEHMNALQNLFSSLARTRKQ